MFRFNRAVCTLAVCSLVGVALGAAVKIRALTDNCPSCVGEPNPEADGMAILNYAQGVNETVVQVVLDSFTPNKNYCIDFYSPSHCLHPGVCVVTDDRGNAHVHAQLIPGPAVGTCPAETSGDWSDADIQIVDGLGTIYAVGCNPAPGPSGSAECP